MKSQTPIINDRTPPAIGANLRQARKISKIHHLLPPNTNSAALRKSNALFRRGMVNDDDQPVCDAAPEGELRMVNMKSHCEEFVAFVIRSVAYAEENDNDNPYECGDQGELLVDSKPVSWKIVLETKCGTLMSAPHADPMNVPRILTITLPSA